MFAFDPKLGVRMDLVGDKAYLDKLLVRRSQPEYYPLKPERIQVCVSMFILGCAKGLHFRTSFLSVRPQPE